MKAASKQRVKRVRALAIGCLGGLVARILIGRPYLYTLALVGAASLQDLNRDVEWPTPPAFGPGKDSVARG
jgi:hypothetical protein